MHSLRISFALIGLAALGGVGCGSEAEVPTTPRLAGQGLPCAISSVLSHRCWSCHGVKPSGGAPMSLATYDDLAAPSRVDASQTYAERAVVRMGATASPMPPGGGATAEDVAAFQAWIAQGTPSGSCSGPVDPFGGGVVCTSGKTWTQGSDVSDAMQPWMHPGRACNACHAANGGGDGPPIFAVAGTVYPTGHEPDDCWGVGAAGLSGVAVRVVDAQNRSFDLPVNDTGNFFLLDAPFQTPFTAKVVSPKGERTMSSKQTSGDCNACHTRDGGGAASTAPGRIVAP